MHVTIRLFARLREMAGASELSRQVPEGASARCGAAAAITTLASPMSTRPVRWWIARRTSGHGDAASCAMRSKALIASGA